MARNNPKPTEKPDWIPDDTSNIVAPSAGRKTSGWLYLIKPPAENLNWLWNLLSRFTDYFSAQVEDWIVIDSDADEGDYATLAAYLADSPAAGDRVLIKEDQTVTVQTIIPSGVDLKFLNGSRLLCATNIATSVLRFDGNNTIEGVLNIVLSQTGTTAKAVEYNGDNTVGKINVENSSTGTLTTAHHINANKTGNQASGFADNTGGGVLTNYGVDNSTEDSNRIEIVDAVNNQIWRSRGAYKFREGLEFDLGSDADGDFYYRDAGILKRRAKGFNGSYLIIEDGLPIWNQLTWSYGKQVGNDLNIVNSTVPALASLTVSDVAYVADSLDSLRTYRFNGVNWSQVGNSLAISTMGSPAMTALDSSSIAFIDSTNQELRKYSFDGTNWSLTGNGLTITSAGACALAALNNTDVAFIDGTNDDLRVYRFDGSDWAQVGNDLNITGVTNPALTALNETDVAFIDTSNEDLRTYRFDGSDWAQVGNDLNILGIGDPAITALNGTDIVLAESTSDEFTIYRFDNTDWLQVGIPFNITTIGVKCALAAMNGNCFSFIDGSNEDLRFYEFSYSIVDQYHP